MKRELKVAIQGIATSFHEVAAGQYFNVPFETVECLSFHELCRSLDNGKANFAVMAIENSIAGSILPNYFLLQQFHFYIVGEIYLPIHMHLLGIKGSRMEDIKSIESHPMAIRQCSEFLHSLQDIKLIESDDTALSAQKLSQLNIPTLAAVANEAAAKKFGLKILKRHIETHKKNFTRFLVLKKKKLKIESTNKASMSFEVANKVGSLATTLMIFKEHEINLSKIQSVPVIGKPMEYTIHVDLEWKRKDQYSTAIKKVKKEVHNLAIFGEYRKAPLKF